MFVDLMLKKNPSLIKAGVNMHQNGEIMPNTYLIDVDAVRHNARCLVKSAKENNINLYMMTKQIGRNPMLAKIIRECGIEKAVAVDPWEALTLAKEGIKLGNVGHLVQIPKFLIKDILSYEPEIVTVFSVEKAKQISEIATKLNRVQDIMLRVVGKSDNIYDGQVGGFKETELIEKAKEIMNLKGVNIAGVVAFPCFLYDEKANDIKETPNAMTALRCKEILERELNIKLKQINTPSANTSTSMHLLKKLGATHAEPGHALTGTTPLHAYNEELPEIPAMIYVTEISHMFDDKAYVFGGGYYRRSKMKKALVGRDFDQLKENDLKTVELLPESIDYYGTLQIGDKKVRVGDTAIYSYRTQIFVTRSEVVLVEGIQKNKPKIIGAFDSLGKKLDRS
ncbi:YhfX family PLP-dependent enzyme [Clostridiaceae bacterium M8S5]|nr:YhfX family PLP-dependent enzyme [Clostridiaceae bacterium M8S5]